MKLEIKLIHSTILILTIFMVLITPYIAHTSLASPLTSPNQQPGLRYWLYDVTLEGISQGISFQRAGQLIITEGPITGDPVLAGSNPFDVLLASGDPFASPESGSIWLMTDRAMLGQAPFILASAAYDPQLQLITVNIAPDVGIAGTNGFNARSGILATLYLIIGGSMQIQSQDNFQTITGTINVVGRGQTFTTDTWYRAQLTGNFVGEFIL
ncbi:MAG TPA: hypothetical protein VE544_02290 [Nitrososphaeraceae archaeon]|nr:hypothetical protein [Nitrososphaeraceae archaeon]